MTKSIYLINPQSDFPTYYGAEVYAAKGFKPATQVADLAIATVAAMACEHLDVALCDQNISPVDLDTDADFIGITGKVTQWGQMAELTKAFRKRGKVVLIGGPYASLCPEIARPHCDILVKGEIEEIAPELFSDLRLAVGNRNTSAQSQICAVLRYPNGACIRMTEPSSAHFKLRAGARSNANFVTSFNILDANRGISRSAKCWRNSMSCIAMAIEPSFCATTTLPPTDRAPKNCSRL